MLSSANTACEANLQARQSYARRIVIMKSWCCERGARNDNLSPTVVLHFLGLLRNCLFVFTLAILERPA